MRSLTGYDAVVIDCSPAMNLLTYNALLYSEELIVPVGMDLMAIIGARQTLNGVAEVKDLWPDRRLDLLAVLPTFTSASNNATKAALEAIESDPRMGSRVFLPGIRQCIDLNYAASQRQTIWEYAPRSRAADDYTRFLDFVDRPEQAHTHVHNEEAKTFL
jgi:chromosome partitioning protein